MRVDQPRARQAAALTPCRCGHGRGAHEHYRRGHDCGLCACAGFRRWRARDGLPTSLRTAEVGAGR